MLYATFNGRVGLLRARGEKFLPALSHLCSLSICSFIHLISTLFCISYLPFSFLFYFISKGYLQLPFLIRSFPYFLPLLLCLPSSLFNHFSNSLLLSLPFPYSPSPQLVLPPPLHSRADGQREMILKRDSAMHAAPCFNDRDRFHIRGSGISTGLWWLLLFVYCPLNSK